MRIPNKSGRLSSGGVCPLHFCEDARRRCADADVADYETRAAFRSCRLEKQVVSAHVYRADPRRLVDVTLDNCCHVPWTQLTCRQLFCAFETLRSESIKGVTGRHARNDAQSYTDIQLLGVCDVPLILRCQYGYIPFRHSSMGLSDSLTTESNTYGSLTVGVRPDLVPGTRPSTLRPNCTFYTFPAGPCLEVSYLPASVWHYFLGHPVCVCVCVCAGFSHLGIGPNDAAASVGWSAGFLGDLPFPSPLHFGADPYSLHFTLIGSQDVDVKSRSNLSTRNVHLAFECTLAHVRTPQVSIGFRFGKCPGSGQVIGPARPIYLCGNCSARQALAAVLRCSLAPICMNYTLCIRSSGTSSMSYQSLGVRRVLDANSEMGQQLTLHVRTYRTFYTTEARRLQTAGTGHLKAFVYATPVDDAGTIRNRIVAGCETIRNLPGIHQRIQVSMQRRVDACVLLEHGDWFCPASVQLLRRHGGRPCREWRLKADHVHASLTPTAGGNFPQLAPRRYKYALLPGCGGAPPACTCTTARRPLSLLRTNAVRSPAGVIFYTWLSFVCIGRGIHWKKNFNRAPEKLEVTVNGLYAVHHVAYLANGCTFMSASACQAENHVGNSNSPADAQQTTEKYADQERKQKLKLYLQVLKINSDSDISRVALLLNAICDKGIEIYNLFNLAEAEAQVYEYVISRFDKYYSPWKNLLYQRFQFLTLRRPEGMPIQYENEEKRVRGETCRARARAHEEGRVLGRRQRDVESHYSARLHQASCFFFFRLRNWPPVTASRHKHLVGTARVQQIMLLSSAGGNVACGCGLLVMPSHAVPLVVTVHFHKLRPLLAMSSARQETRPECPLVPDQSAYHYIHELAAKKIYTLVREAGKMARKREREREMLAGGCTTSKYKYVFLWSMLWWWTRAGTRIEIAPEEVYTRGLLAGADEVLSQLAGPVADEGLQRLGRSLQHKRRRLLRTNEKKTNKLKAVHDKVSTFEINLRKKKPLLLSAYNLTGALSDMRPVKLVDMDGKKFHILTVTYRPVAAQPIGNLSQQPLANQLQKPFPEPRTANRRVGTRPHQMNRIAISSLHIPISTLASHQGETGSIPSRVTGFSQVGVVPDDAVSRGFSRGSPVSPPFHSGSASYSLQPPSSALKISLL
ncbi:hypothetical protein PR048_003268 [Dryococelus australis]|uniref:Uncharacterized protein n=1 Tax=Dryococelus australis TaxID=614101 RepID=A0ABQ9IMN1_9NEOP|nr:hypothetical protein PR048_003268 [Dryococelus australis]